MSARGPVDLPPSRDGSSPEALPERPAPDEAAALSLRDAAEAAPPAEGQPQAKLVRMEDRRNANPKPRPADWDDGDGFNPPAAPAKPAVDPVPATPAAPAKPPAKPAPKPVAKPAPAALAEPPLLQPAIPARAKARHWIAMLSFLLLVVAPTVLTAWYMWERAAPRYASVAGFSVRTEEASSPSDLLGGFIAMGAGGSSSSDTDILYRYIQSQEIVEAIDARLDLRSLWAKGDPEVDPIFAYHPPGTIEELVEHWESMVSVYNDPTTGLLDVEVQAFAPEDAQAIAQAIFEESQTLINKLSDIAQEDTTRLARQELDAAVERLKLSREALTRFRNETQIVDPVASIQSQMGLLSSLEEQLAQTLIDLDLLRNSGVPDSDPRVEQDLARIEVIEARMAQERSKLGLGRRGAPAGSGEPPAAEAGPAPDGADAIPQGEAFADLVGEYESLMVDQEFAQATYVAAMAGYDAALAKGRQQSRYLAAHVQPTLAERADYPQRWTVTLVTALFALLAWMILTLGAYAFKDRR